MSAAWSQDSAELRRNAVVLIYSLIPGGILIYTVQPLTGWIAQAAFAVPLMARQFILLDRAAMSPGSVSIHPKYSRRRRAIGTRLLFPPAPGRSTELFWYRTFVLSIAGLCLINVALLAVFGLGWLLAPYE